MSFICENCEKTVGNGVGSNRLVVKTRPKIYRVERRDKNGFVSKIAYSGTEIAKEITVCNECMARRRS